MLLSIIIPVFNKADYLEQCVKSIMTQTIDDYEIICVDDCSTDDSLTILKKLKTEDSRIKIICHEENEGPHKSRYD